MTAEEECEAALEILLDGARKMGLGPDVQQREQFVEYCSLLQAANRRMNLTAVRTAEGIMSTLFLESLAIAPVLPARLKDGSPIQVVDVGSGAGIPGLPLRLLFPAWSLTLVESIRKKAAFLEEVVRALDLSRTHVLAQRAERLGAMSELRDAADLCLARAVAPLPTLLELCAPLTTTGGLMVFPKGTGWQEERDQAEPAAEALGARFVEADEVKGIAGDHFNVLYEKTQPTPRGYPRRIGLAKSRPIGVDAGSAKPRGRPTRSG